MTARVPDRKPENGLGRLVGGLDEVGVGSLCGPVVAAVAVLPGPAGGDIPDCLSEVRDSKALSAAKRERLAVAIRETCLFGIGEASPSEIDDIGILPAIFLAMRRAVAALPQTPDHLLVDGNKMPRGLPCPATTIVKGDAISMAIAAASVLAKTHRDRLLRDLDADWPGYGWARNSGYPTGEHREAIARLGLTPHHRRSYRLDPLPAPPAQPGLFDAL